MGKKIAKRSDPLTASFDNLLSVTFAKSTSQSYPLAVNIAQGAAHYEELTIGNKFVHFASFAKSPEDAGRAHTLIHYISGWKSAQFFAGGKLIQNVWQVTQVLECFLEASGCTDWRAHCHKVIDDPYIEEPEQRGISFTISLEDKPRLKQAVEIDRYILPCSFLQQRFRFQIDHPSKPEDQIQAAGVEAGCDWCPNFQPMEYKKIGTRIVIKEFFE